MLRVIRNHRRAACSEKRDYEELHTRPVPLDAGALPGPGLVEAARAGLGRGAGAGRAARLPQRPDHGDRADRHDRPGDGLRHHRHRARLRAGQVQEAGRRRLLQDHQPHGADARSRRSATRRQQIDDIVRYAVGRGTLDGRARDQPRDPARPRASPTRCWSKVEAMLPTAFDIKYVFNHYTLGEAFCRERLGLSDAQLADPASTCCGRSASRAPRSRRPTSSAAAR